VSGRSVRVVIATVTALAPACRHGFERAVPHDSAPGDVDALADDGSLVDAAPPCAAGLLLCDLFDGPIDTTTWTVYGDVQPDTAIKRRGASSLRMHIAAVGPDTEIGSYVGVAGTLITSHPTLWLRAWMRMSALPISTNALELISLQRAGSSGNFVFSRAANTQLYHQFDNRSASAGVGLPLDTWFCLVWRVTVATNNLGSSDLTSDVVPMIAISSSTTQGPQAVNFAGFGPFFSASNVDVAQPAITVWIDDVIIHDQAVSCSD
jgi:hypothetical protein